MHRVLSSACRHHRCVRAVLQGAGVYFYKDGSKYQGEWVAGKRVGRGRMDYANGDMYDGQWDNDKRHGTGILILGVCVRAPVDPVRYIAGYVCLCL
jgi:hypothetical protein